MQSSRSVRVQGARVGWSREGDEATSLSTRSHRFTHRSSGLDRLDSVFDSSRLPAAAAHDRPEALRLAAPSSSAGDVEEVVSRTRPAAG
ncbi:hypothetical protein AAT19DRAFT_12770 [Rhodotorula toruloides]|uniref:Uncharacterized protein n=1 Tax=Rhodotorula toruloides TaxID=5286 RepID=A0A2T0ACL1_RHOTO|nr:hypothetical protein AAT19DRAFT_12770 [Rhodotorula toruloides]